MVIAYFTYQDENQKHHLALNYHDSKSESNKWIAEQISSLNSKNYELISLRSFIISEVPVALCSMLDDIIKIVSPS